MGWEWGWDWEWGNSQEQLRELIPETSGIEGIQWDPGWDLLSGNKDSTRGDTQVGIFGTIPLELMEFRDLGSREEGERTEGEDSREKWPITTGIPAEIFPEIPGKRGWGESPCWELALPGIFGNGKGSLGMWRVGIFFGSFWDPSLRIWGWEQGSLWNCVPRDAGVGTRPLPGSGIDPTNSKFWECRAQNSQVPGILSQTNPGNSKLTQIPGMLILPESQEFWSHTNSRNADPTQIPGMPIPVRSWEC